MTIRFRWTLPVLAVWLIIAVVLSAPAQVPSSPAPSSAGADKNNASSGQTNSGAPGAASKWGAGMDSFRPNSGIVWGTKFKASGSEKGATFSPGAENFGVRGQPGGFWRVQNPGATGATSSAGSVTLPAQMGGDNGAMHGLQVLGGSSAPASVNQMPQQAGQSTGSAPGSGFGATPHGVNQGTSPGPSMSYAPVAHSQVPSLHGVRRRGAGLQSRRGRAFAPSASSGFGSQFAGMNHGLESGGLGSRAQSTGLNARSLLGQTQAGASGSGTSGTLNGSFANSQPQVGFGGTNGGFRRSSRRSGSGLKQKRHGTGQSGGRRNGSGH